MKCLSLHQPWASAVAQGVKKCETRSWATAYRGQVVIHAAKVVPPDMPELLFRWTMDQLGIQVGTLAQLPRGAALAVATLEDCMPITAALVDLLTPEERRWGYWEAGRYAWALSDVIPLHHPVPLRGRQGLFTLTPDQEAMIRGAGLLQSLAMASRVTDG